MRFEAHIDQYGRETKDYIAQGKNGHFLVWKEKYVWRVLYMDDTTKEVKFRFVASDRKDAFRRCKENAYWEKD